jgi:divalent metal cation (Fe/Co/Zn/Cd) transporter
MNICIIISLLLSKYFIYVDVVCGVVIGSYVFYSAFIIMKNAIDDLMDNALPQKTQKNIIEAINSVTGVSSIKILRTRSAGMKKYVEARIIVDGNTSFYDVQKITLNVEKEICNLFEVVDVIVKAESV